MKLNVEGFKDVNYRQYREYSRIVDDIVEEIPEEERDEKSTIEMTEIMLCAALLAGWVEGMDVPDVEPGDYKAFLDDFVEMLYDEHPGKVLTALDDFNTFWMNLRNPDPN